MKDIYTFKRLEKKYILSESEMANFKSLIASRLTPDEHGVSTVCSLYLDTADFRLIRTSAEGGIYKEKLRLRSYGAPEAESKVFFEIKKKYKGIVYKRRVSMKYREALEYIEGADAPVTGQIMDEINYSMKFYGIPKPRCFVLYEREAYFSEEDRGLRITFDGNIRYRMYSDGTAHGLEGTRVLPEGLYVMEIKTADAFPLWLTSALDRLRIYPRSYSKYKASYAHMLGIDPYKELKR